MRKSHTLIGKRGKNVLYSLGDDTSTIIVKEVDKGSNVDFWDREN